MTFYGSGNVIRLAVIMATISRGLLYVAPPKTSGGCYMFSWITREATNFAPAGGAKEKRVVCVFVFKWDT